MYLPAPILYERTNYAVDGIIWYRHRPRKRNNAASEKTASQRVARISLLGKAVAAGITGASFSCYQHTHTMGGLLVLCIIHRPGRLCFRKDAFF